MDNIVEVSGFTFLRRSSDFALVWRNAGPAAPAGRRGLTFDIDRSAETKKLDKMSPL